MFNTAWYLWLLQDPCHISGALLSTVVDANQKKNFKVLCLYYLCILSLPLNSPQIRQFMFSRVFSIFILGILAHFLLVRWWVNFQLRTLVWIHPLFYIRNSWEFLTSLWTFLSFQRCYMFALIFIVC